MPARFSFPKKRSRWERGGFSSEDQAQTKRGSS
jgi:hypothetical protein